MSPGACGVVDHAGSALGAASIRRLDAAGFEGTSKPLIHVRPEDLYPLASLEGQGRRRYRRLAAIWDGHEVGGRAARGIEVNAPLGERLRSIHDGEVRRARSVDASHS